MNAPPSKNEQIKEASRFLRGGIADGLSRVETGAIAEDDAQLTKFHGTYLQDDRDLRPERRKKKLEQAYMFMIRVRVPGGVCTPAQWLAMDRIATNYGNGTLRLTTRQAFQFHGVIKSNLKRTMQAINENLLDTIAACGDVNRNVMCNPNPHQSEAHAAALDLARAIGTHLLPRTGAYHEIWLDGEKVVSSEVEEPIYGRHYLPRKFKTVVAVPPSNDVDVFAQDLGFIAITDAKGQVVGWNVTVGGGMGMTHGEPETFPRTADVMGFCTPGQAVDVAEKVVLVQRDFGDRANRKHARLKYTGDRYGWTKDHRGNWHYTLFIENGRVRDVPERPMKTGLAEIAKIHVGDFRLTANQNLMIASVRPRHKATIDKLLKAHGLTNDFSGLRLNAMACVALPTCGLALAESERYLPDLVTALEDVVEAAGLRG